MIDTCQAASMYEKFYSPNILAVASSLVGEDSLSVNNIKHFLFNCLSLRTMCSKCILELEQCRKVCLMQYIVSASC